MTQSSCCRVIKLSKSVQGGIIVVCILSYVMSPTVGTLNLNRVTTPHLRALAELSVQPGSYLIFLRLCMFYLFLPVSALLGGIFRHFFRAIIPMGTGNYQKHRNNVEVTGDSNNGTSVSSPSLSMALVQSPFLSPLAQPTVFMN